MQPCWVTIVLGPVPRGLWDREKPGLSLHEDGTARAGWMFPQQEGGFICLSLAGGAPISQDVLWHIYAHTHGDGNATLEARWSAIISFELMVNL